MGSPPQLTAPRGSISLDALYRTVYEQSLDAPFREQVDLCTVLGELRRLRDVEALGSDFGHSRWTHGPMDERDRADVEALVPALVKRARDLGIEVDEQEA